VPRSIEILLRRDKTQIQNLNGPQKPLVFYDESKIKPKTSKMGPIPILSASKVQ